MIEKLLQSPENKALFAKLINYANEHKINAATMDAMMIGTVPPVGDDKNFTIKIEDYKIVYSQEWNPDGWMKHLSISKNNQRPEDEEAVVIAEELGYNFNEEIYAYVENFINMENIAVSALNLLQLIPA